MFFGVKWNTLLGKQEKRGIHFKKRKNNSTSNLGEKIKNKTGRIKELKTYNKLLVKLVSWEYKY